MYVVLGITFGASLMLGKHSTIAHCVFVWGFAACSCSCLLGSAASDLDLEESMKPLMWVLGISRGSSAKAINTHNISAACSSVLEICLIFVRRIGFQTESHESWKQATLAHFCNYCWCSCSHPYVNLPVHSLCPLSITLTLSAVIPWVWNIS